jgi:hypothetical protein
MGIDFTSVTAKFVRERYLNLPLSQQPVDSSAVPANITANVLTKSSDTRTRVDMSGLKPARTKKCIDSPAECGARR